MVVHVSSGFAALALAFVVGKRSGYDEYSIEPHNVPMTLLGAALLWFGWFGFNGGSALAANGLAANAIVVTNTSAAVAAAAWMIIGWIKGQVRKPWNCCGHFVLPCHGLQDQEEDRRDP